MDHTQTSLPLNPSSVPSLVVHQHARAIPGWLSRAIAAMEMILVCGIPTQLIVAIGLVFFVQMPIMVDEHLSLEFLALVSLLDTALIAILMRAFLERSGETSRSVFLGVRSTRTDIWRGLKTNDLQVVSTDHCPFCFKGQKDLGRDSFAKIPNGMPGVETRMYLLWDGGVRTGRIASSSTGALFLRESKGPARAQ